MASSCVSYLLPPTLPLPAHGKVQDDGGSDDDGDGDDDDGDGDWRVCSCLNPGEQEHSLSSCLEVMLTSSMLTFMVVFFLESLAAMLQNGFMVAVLGLQWLRCRTLPTADLIIACLAVSRFCLHGMAILNNLMDFFDSKVTYFNIPWDFINTLTFWLTAWLAIFYCVKISIFSHPIFIWLKWRISRSVPRLLLSSLVISSLTTISSIIGNINLASLIMFSGPHVNTTLLARIWTSYHSFFLPNLMLLISVPFLLFLVSILLLIFSLHRHLGQMRGGRSSLHDPSTQAHTMALKSLSFFLIFHTSYFLSLIVVSLRITTFQNHWHWAWEVVTYAGIYLHSSILMFSSPKLRKVLKTRPWKALLRGRLVSTNQYQ
ncbi:Taste receptor type 2 member 134 [Galemys pyrenaicus]|uniref:Taste receptor type 2 member 134 n=1 Tax=Galemys pyrenaicus TaxID=202257 RepID=A0A8J6DRP8_GALPY|nr:Taste receptor type 2 member 134 [Galemys pyrenaicus]